MKTQVYTLNQAVDILLIRLRTYLSMAEPRTNMNHLQLRHEFERYGREARQSGISLDETMSGAIAALRQVFDDADNVSDATITMTAGSALTAVATGYREQSSGQSSRKTFPANPRNLLPNRSTTGPLPHQRAVTTSFRAYGATRSECARHCRGDESDACAVFLFDDATKTLALWSAVGLNTGSIGALSIFPGEGITGMAAQAEPPIVAADAQDHPAWMPCPQFW